LLAKIVNTEKVRLAKPPKSDSTSKRFATFL